MEFVECRLLVRSYQPSYLFLVDKIEQLCPEEEGEEACTRSAQTSSNYFFAPNLGIRRESKFDLRALAAGVVEM